MAKIIVIGETVLSASNGRVSGVPCEKFDYHGLTLTQARRLLADSFYRIKVDHNRLVVVVPFPESVSGARESVIAWLSREHDRGDEDAPTPRSARDVAVSH